MRRASSCGFPCLLLAVFVLQACATLPKGDPHKQAYVFDRPIEQVWPQVGKLLEEEGYRIKQSSEDHVLVTEWKQAFGGSLVSGVFTQVFAVGERLDANHCQVRFFRHETVSDSSRHSQMGSRAFMQLHGTGTNPTNLDADGAAGASVGGSMVNTVRGPEGLASVRESVRSDNQWAARDMGFEWKLVERVIPRTAEELLEIAKAQASATEKAAAAGAPASTKTAAATAAQPAAAAPPPLPIRFGPCGQEIEGAAALIQPSAFLLLGEMSGSREIPALVGRLACTALFSGVPVVLGLEIPRDAQPRLNRYFESKGTAEDVDQLLSDGFWSRPYQDGRSSLAMASLLQSMHELKARGLPISVLAYDLRGLQGNARQEALAQHLLDARSKAPGAMMLVLSGNVQARTLATAAWDPELVPMGALLLQAEPRLKALDAHYEAGTVWTCRAEAKGLLCGERWVPKPKHPFSFPDGRPRLAAADKPSDDGFHGVFYVGKVTASPPVRQLK
jgi:hypothetical protein